MHCLCVGPLPDSWAAPGTKRVAQETCALGPLTKSFCVGGCLKFPLFYSGLGRIESQAQRPCFEKGLFLGRRPSMGGCCAPDASEAWGCTVPGIPPGLGLVGKLWGPGDPILKILPRGLL